jgi:hypothetical protein
MHMDVEDDGEESAMAFGWGFILGVLFGGLIIGLATWKLTYPRWLEEDTQDKILIICKDESTEWKARPVCRADL